MMAMTNGTNNEKESSDFELAENDEPSLYMDCCEILEDPNDVFMAEGHPMSEDDPEEEYQLCQASVIQTPSETLSLAALSSVSVLNVPTQNQFSIQTLNKCLESCLSEDDGDINIDGYLDAYREICKLLDNLGAVIRTHIGKDTKLKVEIMRRHKSGGNGAFYQSLEKMITFEKVKRIHKKNPEENGSRTILILHRSLHFVIEFLRSLNKLRMDDGVGGIGRAAYNRTLAPYHPWAYKNIARIALSTLGKKGQLIANFHDGSMTPGQVHDMVDCVVNAASEVYKRCQAIYEKHGFLNMA